MRCRLQGRAAYCFGAKIELTVGATHQIRWWGADVSYLSQHAAELVFGLGTATHADRVRVTWSDGTISELTGVPAGRLTVHHPDASVGSGP